VLYLPQIPCRVFYRYLLRKIFLNSIPALSKPSSDAVLKTLFPGKFYKYVSPLNEKDSIAFSAWTSPSSAPKAFPQTITDDGALAFPLDKGNQTLIKDFITYSDADGVQHLLVSFSSTEIVPDLLFTGRFSCAVLGLALFSESKGSWVLQAFSPGIGCYGSYQTIPTLHLQKINKTGFGCYFEDINGGAGGPFYGNLFLFAPQGHQFKQVLAKAGSIRTGSSEGWETTIQCDAASGDSLFSDLKLKTEGNYSLLEFKTSEDDTSNIPRGIKGYAKRINKFHFEVSEVFKYEDGQYLFYKEEVGVK
jgi:hypothetical protein